MNPLVRVVRRIVHRVWHRRVRAALERPDACTLFGLDLVIAPGVLHPRHFRSSRALAGHVITLELQGRRVADLGTGSGILALLAARAGASVTAVDINPSAVECAAANAHRNGLSEHVSVLASDLFDAVPPGLRFDLVITNPPFYPRPATRVGDRTFAAGAENAFFRKLAASLPDCLARDGRLILIQSSDVDFTPIVAMFEGSGMRGRVVREDRGLFETLTIREFRAAG
jgi:methylase of polypeptide subunit release factors